MNIVYLSPNAPRFHAHFVSRLRDLGARVFGVGDASYDSLAGDLKQSLVDYYRVDDLADYNQVLRAVAWFTHRYGKIDRIESQNEFWLEQEARLRTDFNVEGVRSDWISHMKQKSLMKEHFREAGVPSARFQLIENADRLRDFASMVGFPIVVKPDVGVGAAHTYRLNDEAALLRFVEHMPGLRFIAEEFVDGDIISFDGIVDRQGNILFATSHIFRERSFMEVVTEDEHLAFYTDRGVEPDVINAGRRLLSAFRARGTFFHFEFFRLREASPGTGKRGELVALEVNMRPPGGHITDMMNFANDTDVYAIWAEMIVHNRNSVPCLRNWYSGYAGRKDWKRYRYSREEVQKRHGNAILFYTRVDPAFARVMGNEIYLFRSAQLEEINEITRTVQAEATA